MQLINDPQTEINIWFKNSVINKITAFYLSGRLVYDPFLVWSRFLEV